MKKTGLIFFPAFDWAISPDHPEREERLLYTRDQIFEEGLMDLPQIEEFKPRIATNKEIARVHICVPTIEAQTKSAHFIAAGSGLVLADLLMKKDIANGFALIRPPGHHANHIVHGNRGFCNINNEAILVEYLRKQYGVKRLVIVDTDVHHGDGTQDIYYHDPDVLFISFHQDGRTLYPGTGFTDELGGARAYGSTINIPLPPGTNDDGLHYVLDELILPFIEDFKPEIIINSAGQDNHYTDPLANMQVSAQGYARLTEKLKPHIAVLEGGYAIETALPYVNMGIILALAKQDYSRVVEPDYFKRDLSQTPRVERQIIAVVQELKELWKQREAVKQVKLADVWKEGYYEEVNQFYYDTDSITENQLKKVHVCKDCNSFMTTISHADYGNKSKCTIYGVTIEYNVCGRCYDLAMDYYYRSKMDSRFNYVYLQDKQKDFYSTFNKGIGEIIVEDNDPQLDELLELEGK